MGIAHIYNDTKMNLDGQRQHPRSDPKTRKRNHHHHNHLINNFLTHHTIAASATNSRAIARRNQSESGQLQTSTELVESEHRASDLPSRHSTSPEATFNYSFYRCVAIGKQFYLMQITIRTTPLAAHDIVKCMQTHETFPNTASTLTRCSCYGGKPATRIYGWPKQ